MDGGNWLTAVGNLLLAGGVFERATLNIYTRSLHTYAAQPSYVQQKSLISAEAKKLPIKDVLNYVIE